MIVFNFLRKHIVIVICLILALSIGGYYIYFYVIDGNKDEKVNNLLKVNLEEAVNDDIDKEDSIASIPVISYYVDIKGEVNNPGVYQLEDGKRVIDAISVSGGLTKNADVSVTNLSRRVFDEMVIIIYSKNEVRDFGNVLKKEEVVQKECVVHIENVVNDSCVTEEDNEDSTPASVDDTKISLNSATIDELMLLPGIGESKAKAIIDYRTNSGSFKTIDDLKKVSGIGESTFEKLKDLITL